MGGEKLDHCDVGLGGIPGDRGWALRDEQAQGIRGGPTLRKLMQCRARYLGTPCDEIHAVEISLPDGTTLRSDDRRTPEHLSDFFGRRVILQPADVTTHSNSSLLSLLTMASLKTLSTLNPQSQFDVRRFRPNLYMETSDDSGGFVEVGWFGRILEIGGLWVSCGRPVHRCSVITYPQPGLLEDSSILRTITLRADRRVGIYAQPARSGSVSVDDPIRLI
jgi:hypothetical protein